MMQGGRGARTQHQRMYVCPRQTKKIIITMRIAIMVMMVMIIMGFHETDR